MNETDLGMTTVVYRRERYACYLRRLKPERIRGYDSLRDDRRIARVMTRWLRRCVRDEAIVVGTARVRAYRDFMTNEVVLRAEAPAFQGVEPEDREFLEGWVDRPGFDAVQIPRFVEIAP